MGVYSAFGQDTSTAATTIVQLRQPASALKRLKLGYVSIGSDATADNSYEASLKRTTANGTDGSSFTPVPRDPADGAASATFGVAHSVEPTYTANADQLPIFAHQRSTFQWYAEPEGEIVIPATNNAGLGCLINTVTTGFNMGVTMAWRE